MNELQIFANDQFGTIRTIDEMGTVLFCGSDVARALGYSRTNEAVTAHCKGTVKRSTPTSGGPQTMLFIPESDVYRLITHSKLPAAERFERWVFDEVLPTIRKTGSYSTQETPQRALTPDDYIKAASIVAACRNERLPYVLALLRAGGLQVPAAEEINQQQHPATYEVLAIVARERRLAYLDSMREF